MPGSADAGDGLSGDHAPHRAHRAVGADGKSEAGGDECALVEPFAGGEEAVDALGAPEAVLDLGGVVQQRVLDGDRDAQGDGALALGRVRQTAVLHHEHVGRSRPGLHSSTCW